MDMNGSPFPNPLRHSCLMIEKRFASVFLFPNFSLLMGTNDTNDSMRYEPGWILQKPLVLSFLFVLWLYSSVAVFIAPV